MARPPSRHPTELELEILKILWRDGPLAVRDVRDRLAEFRDLAYTSVMTIMNIMTDKGYLDRRKDGARFIYEAAVTENETSRNMLGDLVERLFDGSAAAVMLNLLESGEIDERELRDLRRLIDEKMAEEG